MKYLNPEFWFSPIAGAYIVRHNFGDAGNMFSFEGSLKMERAELSDGVYGACCVSRNLADCCLPISARNYSRNMARNTDTFPFT